MRLPGQDMHLLHPLDVSSIKKFTGMQTLSLMSVFRVAVGPAMALVSASEKFLTDPDTGKSKRQLSKLFNEQLRSLANLRNHSAHLLLKVDEYWARSIPPGRGLVQVGLSSWIFDTLSYSMGAVFWGKEGPFEDAVFREQLRCVLHLMQKVEMGLFKITSDSLWFQDFHSKPGIPTQPSYISHPAPSPLSPRLRSAKT